MGDYMRRQEIKNKAKEIVNNRIWDFWKPLIVYYFIAMVIELILLRFIEVNKYQSMIVTTVINILLLPVLLGVNKYHLCIVRGESVDLGLLKNYFGEALKLVGLYLLIELLTFGGFILLIIPGVIVALSLMFVYYVYLDYKLGIIGSIKKSFELTKGHRWDLFVLMLSFIGWIVLSIFTFGVLLIWVVPYLIASMILFYEQLKK